MKLIIEILEEEYIRICDEPCTELALAVRNGTVLPDNPTNGDMIKAMFPNSEIVTKLDSMGYQTIYAKIDKLIAPWKIRWEWWNAPYREDGDKK